MPLAGDLRDLALTDLIQITCQERRQALLVLKHNAEEAEVYFNEGEIVHAQLGDQVGEEVIYHILGWEDGPFEMQSDIPAPARTIEMPWSVLVMSALQQHDEEAWIPDEESWITADIVHQEVVEMANTQGSLQDMLVELGQEIQGFVATAVVGMDGLGVALHAASPATDADSINAQLTMLIKLAQTSVGKLNAGTVEDDLLTTEKAVVQIRFLDDSGYFLVIAADRKNANLGNLRLYSRIYSERLSKALPR